MPVPDIREEVELVFGCKQSSTDRVNGGITPSFIVKATGLVEMVEEFAVRLSSPEVEVADFKVGPDCNW